MICELYYMQTDNEELIKTIRKAFDRNQFQFNWNSGFKYEVDPGGSITYYRKKYRFKPPPDPCCKVFIQKNNFFSNIPPFANPLPREYNS